MRVIDVCYDDLTEAEAISELMKLLHSKMAAAVTYLNLDCLRLAHQRPQYSALLSQMALVLPDGVGVRIATSLVGKQKRAHWNVTDLYLQFIAEAARAGARFFLLGGPDGVAEQAALKLAADLPGIQIVGSHTGFIRDHAAVVAAINASGADVVLVGMGAPLQEKWLFDHSAALNPSLRICVGALFDWVSGRQPRAPRLMQALNLEWLWRIGLEPRRLFKRYIVHDLGFLLQVPFRRPALAPIHLDARASPGRR